MKVMPKVKKGEDMNEKLYLLVLGATLNFDEVKAFLDGQRRITDWFCSMPNSIFLVSPAQASEIYEMIRSKFQEGRLFLTEVSPSNRQGWMPRNHWAKINDVNSEHS